MKNFIKRFSAVLVCIALGQTTVLASSHREAPLIAYDPLADNTDVYAFRSPTDTNSVVLIANYIPFELPQGGPNYYTFGQNVRYEIHVKNSASTSGDDITYRFTFTTTNQDPTTFFNIRLGQQNLKSTYSLERGINGTFTTIVSNGIVPPNNIGPRSIEDGTVGLGTQYETLASNAIMMASSGEKVFCGPRDDPFFVDLGGAFDVGNFRTPGRDGLAKLNVHSIVIEVPVSTLQKDGKTTLQATSILDPDFVIGVWASASRQSMSTFDTTGGEAITSGNFVQVSRLGMPLTNEAIIPIGQKDKWNSIITAIGSDVPYSKHFSNPELALYMDDSQFGTAVPGLSQLRIQTNSLGSFDFRNGKKGLYDLKGTSAVAGTALDDAAFGNVLLPDSMSPRAVDLLPIFLTGVPNLRPYQLATGKNGNPLATGKPIIHNFLPTLSDMLRLNMAVPVTPRNDPDFSSLGIVQAAVLGLTDTLYNKDTSLQFIPNMDGFPNGRRLEDDVTTIELQAVSGIALAALGLWYDDYDPMTSPHPATAQLLNVFGFNAGVTNNDTTFRANFPFVQTPWRGFVGASYAGPLVALPVNWVSFVAEKEGPHVMLRWRVASETNNKYYLILSSTDGQKFKEIGRVNATASAAGNYVFVDTDPSLNSTNYYRIKQVDNDGRFTHSATRTVKFDGQSPIRIHPNPASDFIRVTSTRTGMTAELLDQNGRTVLSQVMTNGTTEFNISRLSKGTYFIVVQSNGIRVETKKIIKQ
ncbi:MAG: DUF4331 family protein [Chitinophagaceae bacterium]